ncbi:MAG: alpha/beta hydrolase [Kofleriaceae bacterium]
MKPEAIPSLDPQVQKFVDDLNAKGGPPLYEMSYADARKLLVDAQTNGVPRMAAKIEDRTLPTGPGGSVSVRIVRPEGSTGTLPAILYCHGGGWILGDQTTHDRLIRELANGTGAAVVFVNYTPSPEAQFPVPIEQAYSALEYIADHADELDLDGSRIAIAGDSVGGNMAAVITQLAKQRGGPDLCYQVLFYPVTDSNFETASYLEFADGPWLTRPAMKWFFDAYAPNLPDRETPMVSPLRASLDELGGLPPALVITDENDVLRDEGEAYAHKLMQAGVETRALRIEGTMHDFVMLDAISDTPETRTAIELANQELRAALA